MTEKEKPEETIKRLKEADLTKFERGILSIVHLNKLLKVSEIKKKVDLGWLEVEFHRRSRKNLWGRFGGCWNWELGFQASSTTLIVNCLIFSLRFEDKSPVLWGENWRTRKNEST